MSDRSPLRTALVTGASRGIGLAIAAALRGIGMTVHGIARNAGELETAAAATGMTPHAVDVTDIAALERLTADLEVDVLVNNAGQISSVRPIAEQEAEEIDRIIDVNLRAPLHLMRLVLPGMIARGVGHVVNITSTAAHHVLPGAAIYGASKAGLSRAGVVSRYDLAGTGVRISEVAPGRVATDIYMDAFGGDRERVRSTLYEGLRTMEPADVAQAVVALINLPVRADVSYLEVVPTDQAMGGQIFAKRRS